MDMYGNSKFVRCNSVVLTIVNFYALAGRKEQTVISADSRASRAHCRGNLGNPSGVEKLICDLMFTAR